MKSIYFFLLITLFTAITSCEEEYGIEDIVLTLDTHPFDEIQLETSADISVIQSNDYRVVISGRERDVYDVEVRVLNDRLIVEERGHNHREDLLIEIYVPELSRLRSTGSSLVYGESFFTQDRNMDITLDGSGEIDFAIDMDNLDIELNGSGYIYLEGNLETLDVELSGSGWVRSFDLESDNADVRIEGSGSAEVTVVSDLDVFISGSGNVYYKGHPSVNAEITGSGSVIDAN